MQISSNRLAVTETRHHIATATCVIPCTSEFSRNLAQASSATAEEQAHNFAAPRFDVVRRSQ